MLMLVIQYHFGMSKLEEAIMLLLGNGKKNIYVYKNKICIM
jgi:hypothetical protein